MKIIGLTGGIGTGKTTVANEFKKLGVPVYIADERSKILLATDSDVITAVKDLIGSEAYCIIDGNEVPDRKFIASIVFNDKSLLDQLNAIMHPAVRKDFDQFCKLNEQASYIIYEAAILFETGGDKRCNQVILVTASEEERIKRVMQRDDVSKEEVIARMKNQWTDKRKLELANFVIVNDDIEELLIYVKNIHEILLNTE